MLLPANLSLVQGLQPYLELSMDDIPCQSQFAAVLFPGTW